MFLCFSSESVRRNAGYENTSQDAIQEVVANHLRFSFDLDGGGSVRKSKGKAARSTEAAGDLEDAISDDYDTDIDMEEF